jgi:hypothetical protein
MAMLQHVNDQAEDMGQAASLKAQLRDLRDDMDLKEALIRSAKESESRAKKDLAVSHLKAKADEDSSAFNLLCSVLQESASKLPETQV